MVDFKAIRAQFPILDQEIHGHLVYLDSAATQKPNAVIDAEANFYRTINAGVPAQLNSLECTWPESPSQGGWRSARNGRR